MSIPPRTPPLAYVWLEARVLKVMKVPYRLKKSTKYQEVEGSHPEENYEWSSRQHSSTN